MSEYDGEVQLSVSLKPGDIKASAQKLSESVSNIFDSNAGKTLDKSLQRVMISMDKVNNKAQSLQAQMKTLETTKVPTAEYQSIAKDIDTVSNKMDVVNQKMKAFESSGNTAAKGYIKLRDEMSKLEKIEDGLLQKSFDLEDSGKAYTEGVNTDKYSKLSIDLAQLNNQQRVNISTYNEAERKLNDVANSTKKVSTQTKAASKNTKTFGNNMKSASKNASGFNINLGKIFKKILMYGFGIRSVYLLVRKVRQAIAEGLNEMAKMNGGANATNKALSALTSSFSAFKNSIAAAVAPLVNLLAPALARIIDLFTATMNRVASFIALLTGASTYMKAIKVQKDYAAGLDKTAKGAKKAEKALKGYLSPLDEINKYQSNKDEDKSGAGGAGELPAFQEVPVDKKLPKWLDDIKKRLKDIWDLFKAGFFKGLGDDWQDRLATLQNGFKQIKDALIDIFTDPNVIASAQRYVDSVIFLLGTIVGAIASIGLTIATNLIAGLGKYLTENTDRIKQYLIDMFDIKTEINEMLSDLFADIADIFSVFAKENGITITSNLIGIFADAVMGIQLLFLRLARDLIQLIVKPLHDNKEAIKEALDDILGVIADFTGIIKEEIDYIVDSAISTYDEHFKPLFDALAEGISDLVGKFLEAWNIYIAPALDDIVAMAQDSWEQYIKPVVDEIFGVLGDLADLILVIWNTKLKPAHAWIVANIMPVLGPIITGLGSLFKAFGDGVFTVIEYVLKNLRAFLQFLKEGFTQGWGQAWDNLAKKFTQNWENMWSKMKGVINKMLAGVEKMVNGIGRALNKLSIDPPAWAEEKLGIGKLGFNIPSVSLPRLAQGAVIPPNKEFMAVLGDQTSGTNIETPLETMKQAFKDALSEAGGANGGVKSIQFILPNRQVIAEYVIEGGRILQSAQGANPFELA